MQQRKFLISGGGTGGHIYPAVAIAKALQMEYPNCAILFVGAKNRMEMEKVPQEGFDIVGLDVLGLKRAISPANLLVIWKFIKSYFSAKKIIKKCQPDWVIGTGGYASLAVMMAAARMHKKTLIWEGNGYAGLTNKILASRVNIICTGFPGMENVFPEDKVRFTGNPVRQSLQTPPDKALSCQHFGLDPQKPVIFITGGSLGARSINTAIQAGLKTFTDQGIQLIWQTGKQFEANTQNLTGIHATAFLREMDLAYGAADLVISRAGALSMSEIAVCGKPSLLVPSPNVTDDHQTKNALQFSDRGAAIVIRDQDVAESLISSAIAILNNPVKLYEIRAALASIAKPQATNSIIQEINKLLQS